MASRGHLGGNLAILVRLLPLPLALGLRSRVFSLMHLLEEAGERRTFRIRVLGRWIGGRTTAKRGQNLRCQARFPPHLMHRVVFDVSNPRRDKPVWHCPECWRRRFRSE